MESMSIWGEGIFWLTFSVLTAAAVWLLYRALIGRRNDGRPRCPKCWYDMTGAPSLTCPECGHDARKASRLRKRRRYPRSTVAAVLMIGVLWYGWHVRNRVLANREPLRSALTPTTALIVMSAYDIDPIAEHWLWARFFDPANRRLRVPAWQAWLEAHAAYRHQMTVPQVGPVPARAFWMLEMLTRDSATARRLWGDLMLNHTSANVCESAARSVTNLQGQHLRTVEMRPYWWRAYDAGKISAPFMDEALRAFGPDPLPLLSDPQLLHECDAASRLLSDAIHEMYLLEVVRRRPPGADKMLSSVPGGGTTWRQLILLTAQRRLAGEPDSVSIRQVPHEWSSHRRVEISLTDAKLTEFAFDTAANADMNRMSYVRFETIDDAGIGAQPPWGVSSFRLGTLKRGELRVFDFHTSYPPARSRLRAALLLDMRDAYGQNYTLFKSRRLLPMSNEVDVPKIGP